MNVGRRAMAIALGLMGLMGLGCGAIGGDQRWVSVERGALVIDVDIEGTLRSVDSSNVGPPGVPGLWNYKISMMAPEGEELEEGQPLLGFDTTELQRRLEQKTSLRDSAAKQLEMTQASARVSGQDTRLSLAEANAELRKARLKAEAPPEITAGIDLEKARLDLALARKKVDYVQRKAESTRRSNQADIDYWRSQRDRAEERVTEIGASIEQMTVTAPRTGTVIYETDWQGEKKKVGDSTWRAATVLEIVSLDEMEAKGEVDEVDASRVAVGQLVSLRLDAQVDVELRGRIREISRTVQRKSPDNPLKVVHIDMTLEPAEGTRLRPGMRFRGKVETARIEDALLVPLTAVVPSPGGPVVYRRQGAGLEAIPVTLGRRNAEHVEVTEGLDEGDEIDAAPLASGREAAR